MISSPNFGPLASTMAVVAALVAAWSVTLLKVFGRAAKWTWYIQNTPSFFVTTGAKVVAIVLMAASFLLVDKSNYLVFLGLAFVLALATLVLLSILDRDRRLHVHVVREAVSGAEGRVLIIGTEDNMLPAARRALNEARKTKGGLSLVDFMSGYGATELNNPEAIWPRDILSSTAHRMALVLTIAFLCGVVAIYVAASAVTAASS